MFDWKTELKLLGVDDRLIHRYEMLLIIGEKQSKGVCYSEVHHILPKCMFPQFAKTKENLVKISGRSHYLCHICLSTMFPDEFGIVIASVLMKSGGRYNVDGIRYNSKLFENHRLRAAQMISDRTKGVSKSVGEQNPMFGRFGESHGAFGHKKSEEFKTMISEVMKKRMSSKEYRKILSNKLKEYFSIPEHRKRASAQKLGELNPNYGKDITNSFSEETRKKQFENQKKVLNAMMPWEKPRWKDDKDMYWCKAVEFKILLDNNTKMSEILLELWGDKSIAVWNAVSSMKERIKNGWDPNTCEKWKSRYK
jgi:Holliday junction resolvase RusA-like endonuclease